MKEGWSGFFTIQENKDSAQFNVHDAHFYVKDKTDEVKETQNLEAGKYIKKPLTLVSGPAIKEELIKNWC